nr:unnamed protein product [Digitaria exilis]
MDCFCFPSEFRTTAAYAVHFPGAEGRNPALVDPSNGSVHEIPSSGVIRTMRGKRCLACTGGSNRWFLVLDEVTRACFLTTLFTAPVPEQSEPSSMVVPLPPMPDDPPHLESFLFNCALSCSSAAPAPGCVVVLGLIGETFLRYCRVGDETWSHVEVTHDDYVDVFDGAVAFHGGKIYATTNASYCVVVDASGPTPAALRVERTDIKIPGPFPSHHPTRPCLVDGIGDTTLFVGNNSLMVSPATEAGTEPNTIHILSSRGDGVRVFTLSLRDMTIRCTFVGMDEDDSYDETIAPPETNAYWSLPSNGR